MRFPQFCPFGNLQALRLKGSPSSSFLQACIRNAQFSGIGLWIVLHSLQSKAHGAVQDCLDPGKETGYQLCPVRKPT